MSQVIETLNSLMKAMEAGGYDAAPSKLTQGAALQVEDLSSVIQLTTFEDKHVRLQKTLSVESCKSTLSQFDRQLSYGQFGGSAQLEGHVGQDQTSDFVRITVPMCYYSHTRRVTLQSMMVATVDGQKSDERAAKDAAMKLTGDIEFDLFRGKSDFTSGGVFDGSPASIPTAHPAILSTEVQIRQSDLFRNTQDLMFNEYGSDESVVIAGGSTLGQEQIEDAWIRSVMNHGNADTLHVDPKVLSNYNKLSFAKERIILAGSAQGSLGSDLGKQYTSGGVVKIEASRFLSGKTQSAAPQAGSPGAPANLAGASVTVAGVTTGFVAGQVYRYYATAANEVGEGARSAVVSVTVTTTGQGVDLTITHPAAGVTRFFNVYRSVANAVATKFIGRVQIAQGAASTVFRDLGNRQPGAVCGQLLQDDTMDIAELAPFSRLKLATTDLTSPEAFFRFLTLRVMQPRKSVLIDNLR